MELSIFDTTVYSIRQAAHYVGVQPHTLLRWTGDDRLISTPPTGGMSFNNLAEAHILRAMRKVHGISMQKIRKALAELSATRQSMHPLLEESFETDGVDLCIREQGQVINLSKRGQREFREFVSLYLHRIQRTDGRATRLYPFIVNDRADEPQTISISPGISFGRPVLDGTGVSTSVIAGRFNARDSIDDLAHEYALSPAVLEDAIRWEMNQGKAA